MKNGLLLITFASLCEPAFAANRLDCMTAPVGQVEQGVLESQIGAARGDDRRDASMWRILEARAQVCSYLYNWSEGAARLAVHHRYSQMQTERLKRGGFSWGFAPQEEARLEAALQPKFDQLISLFAPSVEAVSRGIDAPPPSASMFKDFHILMKEAKLSPNNSALGRLEGLLYERGYSSALERAFSKS